MRTEERNSSSIMLKILMFVFAAALAVSAGLLLQGLTGAEAAYAATGDATSLHAGQSCNAISTQATKRVHIRKHLTLSITSRYTVKLPKGAKVTYRSTSDAAIANIERRTNTIVPSGSGIANLLIKDSRGNSYVYYVKVTIPNINCRYLKEVNRNGYNVKYFKFTNKSGRTVKLDNIELDFFSVGTSYTLSNNWAPMGAANLSTKKSLNKSPIILKTGKSVTFAAGSKYWAKYKKGFSRFKFNYKINGKRYGGVFNATTGKMEEWR